MVEDDWPEAGQCRSDGNAKGSGENVECKLRKYFLETLEVEKKSDDEMENLEENLDLWYASMRKQLVD